MHLFLAAAAAVLALSLSSASAQQRRSPGFAPMAQVKPLRALPQAAAIPGAYRSASANPPQAFLARLDRRLHQSQPKVLTARAPVLPLPHPRVFAQARPVFAQPARQRFAAGPVFAPQPAFAVHALAEAPRGALAPVTRPLPLPVHAPRPAELEDDEDCPPGFGRRHFAEPPLEWREEPDLRRFNRHRPRVARIAALSHAYESRPPVTGGPFPAAYSAPPYSRFVK